MLTSVVGLDTASESSARSRGVCNKVVGGLSSDCTENLKFLSDCATLAIRSLFSYHVVNTNLCGVGSFDSALAIHDALVVTSHDLRSNAISLRCESAWRQLQLVLTQVIARENIHQARRK
jgi:hypothetical protein